MAGNEPLRYWQEYARRINLVLDTIQAKLDQPLTLVELSTIAGFSPYHFHRIFKACTGETLSIYIQRLRLEKAANLLTSDRKISIMSVAMRCGFSSHAFFTRAFKQHFGISPSIYRKENSKHGKDQSNQSQPLSKDEKENSSPFPYNRTNTQTKGEVKMIDVIVKHLPTMHVAYIRHLYGYSKGVENKEIRECFQRVCKWAGVRDLFTPSTLTIGIPYDNPDITPNDRCRYDACVTVPAGTNGDGEVGIQDIAGGKYAVTQISIPASETNKIGEAVDQFYRCWLPDSGYQAEDRPPLEIYYPTPGKAPGEWITMDYCVPVKPA
ncbi:MAG TPA: AraC family transcriptional regulator [Anaerolineaceae bacterium]